jgi:hypothetical protein
MRARMHIILLKVVCLKLSVNSCYARVVDVVRHYFTSKYCSDPVYCTVYTFVTHAIQCSFSAQFAHYLALVVAVFLISYILTGILLYGCQGSGIHVLVINCGVCFAVT